MAKDKIVDKIKNFDFKKFMVNFKDNAINFIKYNRQFISYTILCLISCMLVRYYTIEKSGRSI